MTKTKFVEEVEIDGVTYIATRLKEVDTEWGEIEQLGVSRKDNKRITDFINLYSVKNMVCGKDRAAMEIYPRTERLVNARNNRHLWVLEEGEDPPFGLHPKDGS